MSLASEETPDIGGDDQLHSESFDRRTLLDMEAALDRACSGLPPDSRTHSIRAFIAARIIEHVHAGAHVRASDCTQDAMMRAALGAVDELEKRRLDPAVLLAVASEFSAPSTGPR